MNLWQILRVALRALKRNKLRSFLTTLGIIIGVGAVITTVAIGEGAKAKVQDMFTSMGSNLLIVMSGTSATGGAHGGFGSMPTLTWDDLKAIQSELSSVELAAPLLNTTTQVVSDEQNWSTRVSGTAPDYFIIRNWGMAKGRAISSSDLDTGAKVVVLGQTVVSKLYGANADPIGQTVRIKNIPFVVIGVMAKKGQSPVGTDYDDAATIPYSTFLAKIQGGLKSYISGMIFVGARSPADTARAESQIAALLRDRHHLASGVEDDFSIRNLTEMASAQEEGTKTLTTLLFCIAVVSLVVGGIGIMNIMLVSVTERTREIGLRMAVGAKPAHILWQFLVESLTLSTMGGLVGIALGILTAQTLAGRFGWTTLIRVDVIVIAVGFSSLVGMLFGLYPAARAAALDPIEALRYE